MKKGVSGMSAPREQRPFSPGPRTRVFVASIGGTVFLLGIVLLVLNIRGLLPLSDVGLTTFGLILPLVGVLVNVLVWAFPVQTSESPSGGHGSSSTPSHIIDQDRYVQVLQFNLDRLLDNSTIAVFGTSRELGCLIHVTPLRSWQQHDFTGSRERSIGSQLVDTGRFVYVAVFANLPPGDYMVWIDDSNQPFSVSLAPCKVQKVVIS